jgi:hypothetical protein
MVTAVVLEREGETTPMAVCGGGGSNQRSRYSKDGRDVCDEFPGGSISQNSTPSRLVAATADAVRTGRSSCETVAQRNETDRQLRTVSMSMVMSPAEDHLVAAGTPATITEPERPARAHQFGSSGNLTSGQRLLDREAPLPIGNEDRAAARQGNPGET